MANRVTIIIGADGKAYIEGMEQVEGSTKRLEDTTRSVTGTLKAHWMSVVAAVYSMKKAWDLADMAAQFDEQKRGLNSLAAQYGTTANSIIASLQRAADGTIARVDAITVANRGLIMGLDPSQLEKFTYAAKRMSGVLGGDTATAFERLTQAMAAGQERTLKSIGILVDFQGEYKKYGRELTLAEQQTVNFNAVSRVLDDALKRMGPDTDTAADAMERFTAFLKDAGLIIGKVLITAASWTGTFVMGFSKTFAELIWYITGILSKLAELGARLPWVGDKFKGLSGVLKEVSEFEKGVAEEAERMGLAAFDVGAGIWKEAEAVQGLNTAMDRTVQLSAHTDEWWKKEEERTKAFVELQKPYIENLNEMNDAYMRQTLTQGEYLTWYAQELALKGVDLNLINELIKAKQRDAQLDEEKKRFWERVAAMGELTQFEINSPYGELAQLREAAELSEIAAIKLKYDTKLEMLRTYNSQVLAAMVIAGASQAEVEAAYAHLTVETERQTAQAKLQAYAQTAALVSGFAANLYSALGQKQKAFFYASKAAAVAEAIINAELGAAKAVGQGGIWGIPFAAIIRTMGYANAAIIAATAITGAGTGGGAGNSPSISSSFSSDFSPVPQKTTEVAPQKEVIINIYNPISGKVADEIQETIIDLLNKAAGMNYKIDARIIG